MTVLAAGGYDCMNDPVRPSVCDHDPGPAEPAVGLLHRLNGPVDQLA
jgi:hypothetical protein